MPRRDLLQLAGVVVVEVHAEVERVGLAGGRGRQVLDVEWRREFRHDVEWRREFRHDLEWRREFRHDLLNARLVGHVHPLPFQLKSFLIAPLIMRMSCLIAPLIQLKSFRHVLGELRGLWRHRGRSTFDEPPLLLTQRSLLPEEVDNLVETPSGAHQLRRRLRADGPAALRGGKDDLGEPRMDPFPAALQVTKLALVQVREPLREHAFEPCGRAPQMPLSQVNA